MTQYRALKPLSPQSGPIVEPGELVPEAAFSSPEAPQILLALGAIEVVPAEQPTRRPSPEPVPAA